MLGATEGVRFHGVSVGWALRVSYTPTSGTASPAGARSASGCARSSSPCAPRPEFSGAAPMGRGGRYRPPSLSIAAGPAGGWWCAMGPATPKHGPGPPAAFPAGGGADPLEQPGSLRAAAASVPAPGRRLWSRGPLSWRWFPGPSGSTPRLFARLPRGLSLCGVLLPGYPPPQAIRFTSGLPNR